LVHSRLNEKEQAPEEKMKSVRLLPVILSFLLASILILAPESAASDEDCLACHADRQLKDAGGLSLFIDEPEFRRSVHGEAGFDCLSCHADLANLTEFPHAEKPAPVNCTSCHEGAAIDVRAGIHGRLNPQSLMCTDCHGTHGILRKTSPESRVFPLNLPQTCEKCHLEKNKDERGKEFIREYEKSVHFHALSDSGLVMSANCSNCHGGHDIRNTEDPLSLVSRKNIIATCGRCHVRIERDYLEGVHGKDYVKGIAEVPVCTDCHSEHNILSPQNLEARVYSTRVAAVCARCHDDERLARQYGFLTQRLKTYSNSFHGTASRFGEARVANCASCHGFHDILPSSNPRSSIAPANLPKTCGQCHPGAGQNFAKGNIHVVSEKATNRWAHYVKVFYILLIAGIVFIFLVFIGADLFHRLSVRWKS
jgi:predicted CXXCH cytochrome family protein